MRRQQNHYSEEFKAAVVRQVLQGIMTKESARRHYRIAGKSTVLKWLRLYEKYGLCSIPSSYKTMASEQSKTSKKDFPTSESTSEQRQLEQRIKELERQLEDAQLLGEMYDRMIKIAEREYKIPIRKKPDTK